MGFGKLKNKRRRRQEPIIIFFFVKVLTSIMVQSIIFPFCQKVDFAIYFT